MNPSPPKSSPVRLPFFDILRGISLIAMTIYHFTWDLEFYGWILPGTTLEGGWVIFARAIATSFLFLVGVSLMLAHAEVIRWRGYWKRLVQVAAAAAVITVTTYIAFPETFIFFGILHAIAVFSVLALAFVGLHWSISALAAVAIFVIWKVAKVDLFQLPVLWWIGLVPKPPLSNDYVPVFPWLAATLAGIALANLAARLGVLKPFGAIDLPTLLSKPLSFIGQHSLVYYMLHQPVMLGLLWVFTAFAGPPDRTASFLHLCTKQCSQTRGEMFCKPYCECVGDGMKRELIFEPFHEGAVNIATDPTARRIIEQCSAAQKQ
ncbi:MAG: heparan-alpha-glucosaminide N-acetyltransferase [Rhizobiaceae bacterium]